MITKMIAGATRVLGKAQGYLGLPIRDEPFEDTQTGTTPTMVSAWEPTPEEAAHIAAGGTIYVRIMGTRHPPIMIWAEPPT